jgi:hypothetical protein
MNVKSHIDSLIGEIWWILGSSNYNLTSLFGAIERM